MFIQGNIHGKYKTNRYTGEQVYTYILIDKLYIMETSIQRTIVLYGGKQGNMGENSGKGGQGKSLNLQKCIMENNNSKNSKIK